MVYEMIIEKFHSTFRIIYPKVDLKRILMKVIFKIQFRIWAKILNFPHISQITGGPGKIREDMEKWGGKLKF